MSNRWTSALNRAALQRSDIYGVWLLELDFASGTLRVHDGGIELSFGGNTYAALGLFGQFDPIEESVNFVARGKRFTLSGVDSGLVATIVSEVDRYQGRAARLHCGLIDPNTIAFVDTPELFWAGYMDTIDLECAESESIITVSCEHRLRNAPLYSRFSDADQKARSPGDRFFDLCHYVAGYVSSWGGKPTLWDTGPGGGRRLD